ncbi:MAG: hypothetical protein KKD28_03075, partial [Chloroflexi bacterium]|nr:hypothetical protein [Chloroflexota bacterium]
AYSSLIYKIGMDGSGDILQLQIGVRNYFYKSVHYVGQLPDLDVLEMDQLFLGWIYREDHNQYS